MKPRTLFAVLCIATAALACGGGTNTADMSAYSVSLTDPWKSMNLPIGEGAVMYSDATALTVVYTNGKVEDVGPKYEEAVKAQGWAETFKSNDGGMTTASYSKDGKTLSLSATSAAGQLTVTMAVM